MRARERGACTENGEGVRGGGAEGDGDAGKDVVLGGGGELACVGGSPQEEAIQTANTELKGGNGQGETSRAACVGCGDLFGICRSVACTPKATT